RIGLGADHAVVRARPAAHRVREDVGIGRAGALARDLDAIVGGARVAVVAVAPARWAHALALDADLVAVAVIAVASAIAVELAARRGDAAHPGHADVAGRAGGVHRGVLAFIGRADALVTRAGHAVVAGRDGRRDAAAFHAGEPAVAVDAVVGAVLVALAFDTGV